MTTATRCMRWGNARTTVGNGIPLIEWLRVRSTKWRRVHSWWCRIRWVMMVRRLALGIALIIIKGGAHWRCCRRVDTAHAADAAAQIPHAAMLLMMRVGIRIMEHGRRLDKWDGRTKICRRRRRRWRGTAAGGWSVRTIIVGHAIFGWLLMMIPWGVSAVVVGRCWLVGGFGGTLGSLSELHGSSVMDILVCLLCLSFPSQPSFSFHYPNLGGLFFFDCEKSIW